MANRVAVSRQSEVSVDFEKVLRHEVFSPERSLNQAIAMRVCIRSINQSNRPIVCCVCFIRAFHFKVMRKSLYFPHFVVRFY